MKKDALCHYVFDYLLLYLVQTDLLKLNAATKIKILLFQKSFLPLGNYIALLNGLSVVTFLLVLLCGL